ncbi:type II toxin-antitoxin system VapC family toxin [Nocardia sp. NPDC050175]|uniref:type II toxin-antitoxin system VapC family toxin n=1 Tax=Nocardia sp. NPDC050175 TaxID=3364317 RepID=UPI0037A1D2DB
MIEVCWLLEERPDVEAAFLDRVEEDVFELVSFTKPDVGRIAELVRQYADFPLGTVDASVIAVAERFDSDRVATLDRKHFSVVRPAHVPTFTLLP